MRVRECAQETEVVEAVLAGRWEAGTEQELREHAAHCEVCGAAAELATALSAERDAALSEAHVLSSGAAWWRAQMRARADADRQAARPVNVALGFATICALLVTGLAIPFAFGWLQSSFGWFAGVVSTIDLSAFAPDPAISADAPLVAWFPLITAVGAAVCLLVAPVVVYFAISRD